MYIKKMRAPDGKMRKAQAANIEGILRVIQSIKSPKAEPLKCGGKSWSRTT